MFRVELKEEANSVVMRIQGELVGEYAEHARTLLPNGASARQVLVDLRDVIYVDQKGEQVLTHFKDVGAQFIDGSLYARYLCDRLDLPRAQTEFPLDQAKSPAT